MEGATKKRKVGDDADDEKIGVKEEDSNVHDQIGWAILGCITAGDAFLISPF